MIGIMEYLANYAGKRDEKESKRIFGKKTKKQ